MRTVLSFSTHEAALNKKIKAVLSNISTIFKHQLGKTKTNNINLVNMWKLCHLPPSKRHPVDLSVEESYLINVHQKLQMTYD